jgi:multidrug resistance efflux pump
MRPLKIAFAVVVLSMTATISGRGEEPPTQRKNRPRARQTAEALEQRVAALEKELEALRAELATLKGPPASTAALPEIKVIPLKNSNADASAKLVQDLFGPDSHIGAAAEPISNSVILTGPPQRIQLIESLLLALDESAGQSKAGEIAATIRQKFEPHAAELRARFAQAEADVKARQEQLQRMELLARKGYVTQLQVEAEQAALEAAKAVLAQARRGLDAVSGETSPEAKQPE